MGICLQTSHPLPWTLQWEANSHLLPACFSYTNAHEINQPNHQHCVLIGNHYYIQRAPSFEFQHFSRASIFEEKLACAILCLCQTMGDDALTKNFVFFLHFSTWYREYSAFHLWDSGQVAQAARAWPLGGTLKVIRLEWGQLLSLCWNFWFSVRQINWLSDCMSYS